MSSATHAWRDDGEPRCWPGRPAARRAARDRCLVEVTVPVYNEEKVLAESVRRLHAYLTANLPFRFVITIADNASTDATFAIAKRICAGAPRGHGPSIWTARAAGCAAPRLGQQRGRRRRLHGRRPVHRPGRVPAAGRSAAVRSQRPGHRQPAAPGARRGPRAQARDHLARLQPAAAAVLAPASPTRSAGSRPAAPNRRACCPASRTTSWFFDTETADAGPAARAAHL